MDGQVDRESARSLYETLSSTGHMLRHCLGMVISVPVLDKEGHIVDRFAAAQIPDWKIRQQLDDIDASLAAHNPEASK